MLLITFLSISTNDSQCVLQSKKKKKLRWFSFFIYSIISEKIWNIEKKKYNKGIYKEKFLEHNCVRYVILLKYFTKTDNVNEKKNIKYNNI